MLGEPYQIWSSFSHYTFSCFFMSFMVRVLETCVFGHGKERYESHVVARLGLKRDAQLVSFSIVSSTLQR